MTSHMMFSTIIQSVQYYQHTRLITVSSILTITDASVRIFQLICEVSTLRPHVYVTRETREGWPLLTDETEMNGDSKSTNEKEVLL